MHATGKKNRFGQIVRHQKDGEATFAPKPLKLAEAWLTDRRALWERRLDQFDAYVKTLKDEK